MKAKNFILVIKPLMKMIRNLTFENLKGIA
jgi:hypothetical protein